MDLFAARLVDHDIREECDKLGRGALSRLAGRVLRRAAGGKTLRGLLILIRASAVFTLRATKVPPAPLCKRTDFFGVLQSPHRSMAMRVIRNSIIPTCRRWPAVDNVRWMDKCEFAA
jgi:hypothetical protein